MPIVFRTFSSPRPSPSLAPAAGCSECGFDEDPAFRSRPTERFYTQDPSQIEVSPFGELLTLLAGARRVRLV